jgi:hypothetical protein
MSVAEFTIEHMTVIIEQEMGRPEKWSYDVVVPAERLEADICELAGHLAATTCRFLDLIGEYDQRGAWASWDMRSCAAWLSWKCQLAPGTAREHVRVAGALRGLPLLHAEFAAGRMSYSKIRELTRIATPATEEDLVIMAGPMTAGQVERFARAYQRCSRDGNQDQDEPASTVRWRQDDDTGVLHLAARLTPADAAVVLQALHAATGDLEHPHDPQAQQQLDLGGTQRPPRLETPVGNLAEALTEMAASYLRGKIITAENADVYQVIVHTTPEALAGTAGPDNSEDVPAGTPSLLPIGHPAWPGRCHIEDGPALDPVDAQVIACQCTVSAMLHDTKSGAVLNVGRRSRRASAAIRRAVRERDGVRCAFPGCQSRRTDLHHIQWWSMGGATSADNLLPVCRTHHGLIHRHRYIITRTPGGYTFTNPSTGTVTGPIGNLPEPAGQISAIHDADITPGTIQRALGERLDLHFAIWVALNRGRPDLAVHC